MRALPLLALLPSALAAQDLVLAWPVDCTLGETCFLQNYVDRDDGPGAVDWACGPLTYDGHEGTDIALPSLAAQAAGVEVRAAAAGEVAGIRDGMPDIVPGPGARDLAGRDCGNGLLLRHQGGWQTQYCHLAQGSVTVAEGDRVEADQTLGRIGLSGRTEFPHLHLTVRRDGASVDPFEPSDDGACGATRESLWAKPVRYRPGGIVDAGFANRLPEFDAITAGTAETQVEQGDPLVLWGHFFGGRAGDVVRIEIRRGGRDVLTHEETLDRTQARLSRAAGLRAPPGGWLAGRYDGTVRLLRDGTEIGLAEADIVISAR